jgi:transcriptional regulator with XRE-family HTH domain
MKIVRSKNKSSLAKAFATTPSIEEEIEFRKLIVVEELLQFMKREGINRSELAERMGVPPSRITKMLSGDSNLTIDTLVRAGRAVNADLAQTYVPQGQRGHWVAVRPLSKDASYIEVEFSHKRMKQAPTLSVGDKKPAEKDAEDAA